LHDDRRIRLREAQKYVDPVDPDPQHCNEVVHKYIQMAMDWFDSDDIGRHTLILFAVTDGLACPHVSAECPGHL
jgi:hypothetical protein